jgi:hypothetical protein
MTMDPAPDPTESAMAADAAEEAVEAEVVETEVATVAVAAAMAADRRAGKTRNPWGVWLLSLITFGIYGLYWYYKVNAEVRDYDGSIEVEPGISLLAQFIPIANLVSMVKTGGRIARAQASANRPERCSGGIGFLLIFVLGTWIVYYQSQLNKVWDEYGNPEPGLPV